MVKKWLICLLQKTEWVIRSGASKVAMVDHDALSETAEVLVNNEGLAIRSLLKVQSSPFGNNGDAADHSIKLRFPPNIPPF